MPCPWGMHLDTQPQDAVRATSASRRLLCWTRWE